MSKQDEHERTKLRNYVNKVGAGEALKDTHAGAQLLGAHQSDVARQGFLKALADLCAFGAAKGVDKETMIECLKGAIDGLEHV